MKKILWFILMVAGVLFLLECSLQGLVMSGIVPWTGPYAELAKPYHLLPYFSKKPAHYDPVNGFRWLPGTHRTLKGCSGKLVFYNQFEVNADGFVSQREYPAASRQGVKRYLVFGDSFTDGYYLKENWVNHCNRLFEEKNIPIELYSYALNGSGIISWSRQFEKLQKDSMSFDGIILAVFGNDLARDPFVLHAENAQLYAGWIPAQNLKPDCWKTLQPQELVTDTTSMEKMYGYLTHRPYQWFETLMLFRLPQRLYQAAVLSGKLESESKKLSERFIRRSPSLGPIHRTWFENKYGKEKCDSLYSLLNQCRRMEKEIILAAVPEKSGIKLLQLKEPPAPLAELDHLSQFFSGKLYNGYSDYVNFSESETESCFLKNDGHWNQKGSDLFANGMAKLLIRPYNTP